ncbi:unnamed protein product [Ectocarpus sp. 4 AP-2014]
MATAHAKGIAKYFRREHIEGTIHGCPRLLFLKSTVDCERLVTIFKVTHTGPLTVCSIYVPARPRFHQIYALGKPILTPQGGGEGEEQNHTYTVYPRKTTST